jgi:hypothetical protein
MEKHLILNALVQIVIILGHILVVLIVVVMMATQENIVWIAGS